MPALCPRIRLHLSKSLLPDEERIPVEGTLDQVHRDMADSEQLGCDYVLLDTYPDDPVALRHSEPSFRMFAAMAEKVLDLANQAVR